MTPLLLVLSACVDAGPAAPALGGVVTVETGESGELVSAVAFGAYVAGTAAVVVSPNGAATCEDAATYYSGGDADWNGEAMSGEGVCNLYVRLDVYDGVETSLESDTDATLSMNCAMDEGSWEFDNQGGYDGYFYTGPWWVGSPEAYTLTATGGEDQTDIVLTVEMEKYTGRFPYDDDNPEADPATGTVSGQVTATYCDDLADEL